MRFYSMKNRYADTFNTPFPASSDAEAIYQIRMVINQKRDPEIIAEDFSLYCVGEFCSDSGCFRYPSDLDDGVCCNVCLVSDCSVLRVKKEGGDLA